ncbi:ALG11 protein [Jimgerdemannia flammicorona]|uniref:GDP-Man:Man(3)GlcNAc(2)-PP-Dol alpha-1,2-mannosyltransferase n=1 Tax=Jimgerdemannia flammicorona TaxID=994334 RepID=A0A433QV53_9FUNG|nr:ALG11 protein [Jimgerdemannia flammicorona]
MLPIENIISIFFLACLLLSFAIGFASISTFTLISLIKARLLSNDRLHRRRVLLPLSPDVDDRPPFILGFFHPYWHARFNIELDPRTISFESLFRRGWVEESRYPCFTLLGQSLGSLILGWEAINTVIPDLFFDTMGYAFTYPMVKLLTDAKVAAYVHYPTISSDMLKRVQERSAQHNNNPAIARNLVWSFGKLIYYRVFAKVYGLCGSFADITVVNSSWTKGHIDELWQTDATIIYPPCDTNHLNTLPLYGRERLVVSVSQFRPEKDHMLQLRSFRYLLYTYPSFQDGPERVELVLIGSSRNQADEDRITALKDEALHLGIHNNVRFEVNASFPQLVEWLGRAKVGLHTMWNEHFGIGVVEYMAAGLVPVVHNSGGPQMDIVVEYNGKPTGYLASDVLGFGNALYTALSLPDAAYREIAENARAAASDKFSELEFREAMLRSLRRSIDG